MLKVGRASCCLYAEVDAIGIRRSVSRSNLAYADRRRDWRVYFELAGILIRKARKLYTQERLIKEIDQAVYALDASVVDLSMSLFPRARFRKSKSAVKIHAMIDLRGPIPAFVAVTGGKVHDVNALDWISLEVGAFYVMDRGYLDFECLARIAASNAFFVIRAKSNMSFYVRKSRVVDKSIGLRVNQTIRLNGLKIKGLYQSGLRRIRYVDTETGKSLVFLTNNFQLDAIVVAKVYKARWQIELFFEWIKQNLRFKAFCGTSESAVKTQIWIALCAYLLGAMASLVAFGPKLYKASGIDLNMSRIL